MCISFKLQPFNEAISGLYKAYCNACCNYWILSNSGKPVTIYCVAGINFCKAFAKQYCKWFECDWNLPLHENVFDEHECPPFCQVTEPYKETVCTIIVPAQCTWVLWKYKQYPHTCYSQSCGHLQGGKIQRMNI